MGGDAAAQGVQGIAAFQYRDYPPLRVLLRDRADHLRDPGVVGLGQVQPESAGLEAEAEDGCLAGTESRDLLVAATRRGRAVEVRIRDPRGIQPAGAPAGGAMDDATITARVKTVLLNDTQVSATKIDVTTAAGVVTISGSVRTPAEATRAVELARSVTGVRDVKSALQVAPES